MTEEQFLEWAKTQSWYNELSLWTTVKDQKTTLVCTLYSYYKAFGDVVNAENIKTLFPVYDLRIKGTTVSSNEGGVGWACVINRDLALKHLWVVYTRYLLEKRSNGS